MAMEQYNGLGTSLQDYMVSKNILFSVNLV